MTDPDHGERLLETARNVLRDELLPALPAHRRHAALMVANAMAITARELQRRRDPALEAALDAQTRRLCPRIRDGGADHGATAAQLHAQLLADAHARVELSNPKYLQRRPT